MQAPGILDLPPPEPDFVIAYGSDPNQFGHLRLPKAASRVPVAIVIHGGFWRAAYDLRHIGHVCEALRKDGIATWSLEYRRIGQAGGGWPGTGEDILAGTAHVRRLASSHPLDLARVVVIGHSAGGHLALYAGIRKPLVLCGVVALAPVADLRRAAELKLSRGVVGELLGSAAYEDASPIEMLPAHIPQRLVHGTADDIVPMELSRRYEDRARAKGDDCRLIPLPAAGHFELIDPRTKEFPIVRDAVTHLLSLA